MHRKETKIFYGKEGKSGENILWKARKIREKYFKESKENPGKKILWKARKIREKYFTKH